MPLTEACSERWNPASGRVRSTPEGENSSGRRVPPEAASLPRLRTGRRPVLFFLLAVFLPAPAARADPSNAPPENAAAENVIVRLPPWVIEGGNEAHPAPARDDSFASLFGATSVLGQKSWAGRSITTLSEALRQTPGLVLQESFGGFEPPRFVIRGSGLDSAPTGRGVALLVDGLSFARADGGFNSGLLDPLLFPRIEIYRGTLHAALTPAALGGVLDAVSTPTGKPAKMLQVQAGAFDLWRGQLADDVELPGTTVNLAASYVRQQGCRAHSGQERTAVLVRAQHFFAPDRVMETTVYFANPRYEVPGPLTLTEALANPRSVSAAALRDQPRRDSALFRFATQYKSGQPGGATAAGLAWQHWSDDFRQLQPNGETDATGDDLNGHFTLSRRVSSGTYEHHLLARAVFSTGTSSQNRYRNDRGQRGACFGNADLRADTLALSGEDIVWLRPNLALGGGVTLLRAQRKIADLLTPAGSPAGLTRTVRVSDISPRAGLQWEARPAVSVYAALSRGAEPPTFDDLMAVQGNYPDLSLRSRDLNAQRATTAELGARGRADRLTWNVTVYHAWWRDEILRLADAAGLPRGAVNAARTRHEGVEATLQWRLIDTAHRLTLTTTATWSRFRFDRDPVYGDNRIAGAPPQLGEAELLYENPRGWFAGVETSWIAGRTPVDHANRLFYGGHALCDVRLGWKFRNQLTVFAAGKNLFDRHYIASTAGVLDLARNPAATAIFLPGNGRSFSCGMEYHW